MSGRWNKVQVVRKYRHPHKGLQSEVSTITREEAKQEIIAQNVAAGYEVPEDWEMDDFEARILDEAQQLTRRTVVLAERGKSIVILPATAVESVTIKVLDPVQLDLTLPN